MSRRRSRVPVNPPVVVANEGEYTLTGSFPEAIHITGFIEDYLTKINGIYMFFKMYQGKPIYKNGDAGTFFQFVPYGSCWVISKEDLSGHSRSRRCIYGYPRTNRRAVNPLDVKGTWSCVNGPIDGTHRSYSKTCNITLEELTKADARGRKLSVYKPGMYDLKGLLPLYATYNQVGTNHFDMLPRHSVIPIYDIHANPEDFSHSVVYGRTDKGYIPLGEYHGKEFVNRVGDLPEPEVEIELQLPEEQVMVSETTQVAAQEQAERTAAVVASVVNA